MTAKQVGFVVLLDPHGRALGRRATIEETEGKTCVACQKPIDVVRHKRCSFGRFGHHMVQQTVETYDRA